MGEWSGVPNAEWPFFWLSGCNSRLREKHELFVISIQEQRKVLVYKIDDIESKLIHFWKYKHPKNVSFWIKVRQKSS